MRAASSPPPAIVVTEGDSGRNCWRRASSSRLLRVGHRLVERLDDDVVARPLGLLPQAAPTEPDEWLEPVDGADAPRERVHEDVGARNMCEFVSQAPNLDPRARPAAGILRKQDDGPNDAARHRSADLCVTQDANAAA